MLKYIVYKGYVMNGWVYLLINELSSRNVTPVIGMLYTFRGEDIALTEASIGIHKRLHRQTKAVRHC